MCQKLVKFDKIIIICIGIIIGDMKNSDYIFSINIAQIQLLTESVYINLVAK